MDNEELQKQIDNLQSQIDALKNYATIPLEIGNAMKARIIPDSFITGTTNATSPSVKSVNESGSQTYNVANVMTGFITIIIDGTSYAVPYY